MNTADSVKKRLAEIGRDSKPRGDVQRLMTRYAIERFLWRIGQSKYADQFTLKGAMAFTYYAPNSSRTTKDADFLLRGDYSIQSIGKLLSEIAVIRANDGVVFDANGVKVSTAGRERAYPGYSARVPARLGDSPCHVLLDISFGEAVHPDPQRVRLSSLLVEKSLYPILRVYPMETIIAEKYQTIVRLGMGNTRLKDHHDLFEISRSASIMGVSLQKALGATFERRGTGLEAGVPMGLSEGFYSDKGKQKEWKATLAGHNMPRGTLLKEACEAIIQMINPVLAATLDGDEFDKVWHQGEWRPI